MHPVVAVAMVVMMIAIYLKFKRWQSEMIALMQQRDDAWRFIAQTGQEARYEAWRHGVQLPPSPQQQWPDSEPESTSGHSSRAAS